MVKHPGDTVGANEGTEKGLLGNFGIILVRFDQGFNFRESASFREAFNGQVLRVSSGERGSVVFGYGGVDFQGFVWVVFGSKLGFCSGY